MLDQLQPSTTAHQITSPTGLRVRQDLYVVGAEQDHIVPWQAAWQLSKLASGSVRFVLAGSGHIAGIINPPIKGRGYWTHRQPASELPSPEAWVQGSQQHAGSWWTDWVEWLRPRSGKRVRPPRVGSKAHPPLGPAPGTYVLEK